MVLCIYIPQVGVTFKVGVGLVKLRLHMQGLPRKSSDEIKRDLVKNVNTLKSDMGKERYADAEERLAHIMQPSQYLKTKYPEVFKYLGDNADRDDGIDEDGIDDSPVGGDGAVRV